MEDVHGEGADDADEQPQEEPGEQCTAEELKQAWQAHCAACRLLEKEGTRVPPELLTAAREQRDAAERRWRDAKPPHPLHKRLRWAEVELREAEAKEAAHRQELQDHLEAAARRTSEIEAKLAIDAARTARKLEALRSLQGQGRTHESSATERAARMAATGICMDVAPVLSAAIESLGDDAAEVRQELQLAVVSLGRVEGILRDAAGEAMEARQAATAATHYDISDATTKGSDSSAGIGVVPALHTRTGDGRGSGERTPVAAVPRWAGPDRSDGKWGGPAWKKQAVVSDGASQQGAAGPGGRDAATSLQAAEDARRELEEGQRRAAMAAGAAATAAGAQGNGGAGAAVQDVNAEAERQRQEEEQRLQAQRQETLRRQQEEVARAQAAEAEREARERHELLAKLSPEELRRAAEMHNQQAAIAAAGFGTQQAAHGAGIVHQQQVHQVVHGAAARGVEADADALMGMSAEELAEWDRNAQESSGQVPW